MRKKSQDELGTLVTREMKVMLQDASLTKEQRFDVLTAVMFDAPVKNTLLASFAKSLKAGFERVNTVRYKAISCHRESAKEEARRAREAKRKLLDIGINDNQLQSIDINGNQLTTTSTHIHRQSKSISPYKPPKGGKREPKVIEPEDLLAEAEMLPRSGRRKKGGERITRGGARESGHGVTDGVRTATLDELAVILAGDIEKTDAFAHMRVNRRNLMRYLIPLVKKNCAAEDGSEGRTSDAERKAFSKMRSLVLAGLAAWTEKWKADDWQYAPGKITKWLADEKWLEEPRKKTAAPEEGRGCGECGAEIV